MAFLLAYCVAFPCNPPRIAAENRLACGAKILVIRRTLLTKTASTKQQKTIKQNREENNYGQIHLYAD
jgi:hypothetical protein